MTDISNFKRKPGPAATPEYQAKAKAMCQAVKMALRVQGVDPKEAGARMGLARTTIGRHLTKGTLTIADICALSDYLPEFSWDYWLGQGRTPKEFLAIETQHVPYVHVKFSGTDADMNSLAMIYSDARVFGEQPSKDHQEGVQEAQERENSPALDAGTDPGVSSPEMAALASRFSDAPMTFETEEIA